MRTGMYELIVIWENGDRDIYVYPDADAAQKHGDDMRTALGKQISWYGIRPQVNGIN